MARRRRVHPRDRPSASFRRDRRYSKTTIAGRDFYDVDIGKDAPLSERDGRILLAWAIGILATALAVGALVIYVI